MKRFALACIMVLFMFSECFAAWWNGSITDLQIETVSAAFEKVQNCLKSLDGTSDDPPTNVVAKNLKLNGATSGTITISPPAVAGTRTVTLPAANSVTLPSGAIFFMITGSCPTGTTDVTATYSNKFIKVNATAGTSSGTVLTGTSDSHTLTTGEIPAHPHAIAVSANAPVGSSPTYISATNTLAAGTNLTTATDGGSGGGHTHTLSSATTLEPSSVTCIMCQVD